MSTFEERWPSIFILRSATRAVYYEAFTSTAIRNGKQIEGYAVGTLKDGYELRKHGVCATVEEAQTACKILLGAYTFLRYTPETTFIASIKTPHGFYSFDPTVETAQLENGNIVVREQRSGNITTMLLNPQDAYITFLPRQGEVE